MPPRLTPVGPETAAPFEARRRAMRLALLAGAVALALGACGRRGRPEPPPDPAAPAATQKQGVSGKVQAGGRGGAVSRTEPETTPTTLTNRPLAATQNTSDDDDEEDDPSAGVSPQPTPTGRKRVRAYQVPKQPFLLDPLL